MKKCQHTFILYKSGCPCSKCGQLGQTHQEMVEFYQKKNI